MQEPNRLSDASLDRTADSAISVTDALSIAKRSLESIVVNVVGEVSECSNKPGYKAVYFTIKDESSSLPCMMWMNRYNSCGVELNVGMLVELTGRFSLYAAKGRMSFDVFSISVAGEGNLRIKVANLAKKLEAEGLMDRQRKKPTPKHPSRIGVVTSPRGAAVYDVLRTLRRRYPIAEVVFAGVGVEGQNAPADMSRALRAVDESGVDVILLVRGGGSFEDLMPFNDEGLARTIASLSTPVITGIGHEPDNSIADMVSDLRASTPTAAAEAATMDIEKIKKDLQQIAEKQSRLLLTRLGHSRDVLRRYLEMPLFQDSMRMLSKEAMQLDEMSFRLGAAIPKGIENRKVSLQRISQSMSSMLSSLLTEPRHRLQSARSSIALSSRHCTESFEKRVQMMASRLQDLSPLSILSRGYAIARTEDGGVVKSIDEVEGNQRIDVQVSDGIIDCVVDGKDKIELAIEREV